VSKLATSLAIAAVGAFGVACRSDAQIRRLVPRCYQLEIGPWRPVLGSNERYHRLPTQIRLDTTSWPTHGRHLEPNIAYPYARSFPETPRWRGSGDSISLLWSNGFSVTRVMLIQHGANLAGEAVAESDDHPIPTKPVPRARVVARAASCAEQGARASKSSLLRR